MLLSSEKSMMFMNLIRNPAVKNVFDEKQLVVRVSSRVHLLGRGRFVWLLESVRARGHGGGHGVRGGARAAPRPARAAAARRPARRGRGPLLSAVRAIFLASATVLMRHI